MSINYPNVLQDDDGIRPAGGPAECFYCKQKVGTPHVSPCPCVTKRIECKYIFTIEIDIPEYWDMQDFESHRNNSSWCASNAISDLEKYQAERGMNCLCSNFEAEWVKIVDGTPKIRSRAEVDDLYKKIIKMKEEL